ncbi:hypothetical protein ACS0TY_011584 [Phlomoides rotata]
MQNKGKFPSTTELNPKEHCKAMKLRSGMSYQGPSIPNEHDDEEKKNEKDEEEEIAPLKEDEEKEESEPVQEEEE